MHNIYFLSIGIFNKRMEFWNKPLINPAVETEWEELTGQPNEPAPTPEKELVESHADAGTGSTGEAMQSRWGNAVEVDWQGAGAGWMGGTVRTYYGNRYSFVFPSPDWNRRHGEGKKNKHK